MKVIKLIYLVFLLSNVFIVKNTTAQINYNTQETDFVVCDFQETISYLYLFEFQLDEEDTQEKIKSILSYRKALKRNNNYSYSSVIIDCNDTTPNWFSKQFNLLDKPPPSNLC